MPFKEVSYHLPCMTFTFEEILPLACVDRYFDRGACRLVGAMETWQPRLSESLRPSGESSAFKRGLRRGKGSKLMLLLVGIWKLDRTAKREMQIGLG